MTSKDTALGDSALRDKILKMERATIAAFKAKADREFTRYFSKSYVGIANDGIKTAADEVAGMHKLDLKDIGVEGERVEFPANNVAIAIYTMKVNGSLGAQPIEGSIFTSTVYIQQGEQWNAVLHTESMAPPSG
jgi:hypothetical protein